MIGKQLKIVCRDDKTGIKSQRSNSATQSWENWQWAGCVRKLGCITLTEYEYAYPNCWKKIKCGGTYQLGKYAKKCCNNHTKVLKKINNCKYQWNTLAVLWTQSQNIFVALRGSLFNVEKNGCKMIWFWITGHCIDIPKLGICFNMQVNMQLQAPVSV